MSAECVSDVVAFPKPSFFSVAAGARTRDQRMKSPEETDEQVAVVSWSCEFFGNGACRAAQDSGAQRAFANSFANSADTLLHRRHPASRITSRYARQTRE